MVLTNSDKELVNSLINVAWSVGAVKSPKEAEAIEALRRRLSEVEEFSGLKKVD